MTTNTATRPDDRLTITINGAPVEIFLSFQRLNSLTRVLEGPENLGQLLIDPDMSENAMRVLLAPTGTSPWEFEIASLEISNDDVEAMLTWATEHLLDFFLKRFSKLNDHKAKLEQFATALQSPQGGSAGSASKTASAGPSA